MPRVTASSSAISALLFPLPRPSRTPPPPRLIINYYYYYSFHDAVEETFPLPPLSFPPVAFSRDTAWRDDDDDDDDDEYNDPYTYTRTYETNEGKHPREGGRSDSADSVLLLLLLRGEVSNRPPARFHRYPLNGTGGRRRRDSTGSWTRHTRSSDRLITGVAPRLMDGRSTDRTNRLYIYSLFFYLLFSSHRNSPKMFLSSKRGNLCSFDFSRSPPCNDTNLRPTGE